MHCAAQFVTGQSAFRVVGQPNFTSAAAATDASGFNNPYRVLIDPINGKLYVSDTFNHRVLRFAYPVATNGPSAELVLGQPDFVSDTPNNGGVSSSSMAQPSAMAMDSSGTLYICDVFNGRVMAFHNAHLISSNMPNADRIIGVPNATTSYGASNVTNQLSTPNCNGIAWEPPDRLWVSSANTHRVLRFENASQKNVGDVADGVLGQVDFTSRVQGDAADRFNAPRGIAVSTSGTLFVVSGLNHRVTYFRNASSKSFLTNSDGILGQPNYATDNPDTSDRKFRSPYGLAVDRSGRLYVADAQNRRLLLFEDAENLADGSPANVVLGKNDFINQFVFITDNGTGNVTGVSVDHVNGVIAVCDNTNNRILLFQASSPLPAGYSEFSAE
jgi:sugar lactone lactonase YvrE